MLTVEYGMVRMGSRTRCLEALLGDVEWVNGVLSSIGNSVIIVDPAGSVRF